MGKNKNTFAKMQRERKKKQKAEAKRQQRLERKAGLASAEPHDSDVSNQEGHGQMEGLQNTAEPTQEDETKTD